jgi:hypothetical protein
MNFDSLAEITQRLERYPGEAGRLFRGISCYAPEFRKTADTIASTPKETK